MSTATATNPSKRTAIDEKELPLVYEVSRREKSSWIPKDKNKHKDINCAKIIVIDVRSRWNAGPGKGEIETQYVPGAPTIFVNDYVEQGKDGIQKGLKSLGYDLKGEDYRRAVQEDIKLVDGFLFLENYGGRNNQTLLQFMYHHGSNEASPNFVRKRNMNTMFLFKPMVKEKKAGAQLDNLEIEEEAMNLFVGLRRKVGDDFEYNQAKIDAILGMLREGQSLNDNESQSKMVLIRPWIKSRPVDFMNMYNLAMKEYGVIINMASKFKVIDIAGKEAVIKITGVEPVKIPLTKDKRDENVEDLTFHFLGTENGRILFSQVRGEVEAKKIEALS